MRGKFGFAVVLLALAAFVASESQSFGGHRKRGRCGSCGSGCATSCSPSGCTTAPAEASPSDAAAVNTPPAPPSADALASPSDRTPQPAPSVTSRSSNDTYYNTRRERRRGSRR